MNLSETENMASILVIDDDPSIRTVFQRYLERLGYVVRVAANGREGIQLMEAEPPDLVITDIMMPEADGLEVIMAIRSKHLKVPVIAISGGHALGTHGFPSPGQKVRRAQSPIQAGRTRRPARHHQRTAGRISQPFSFPFAAA